MARKSQSGRKSSGGSDTRSNASGRSRRSSKSRASRASTSRRSSGGRQGNPMQLSRGGEGGGGRQESVLPSQKWQSPMCCAGGCGSCYGLCVPCAGATARHRLDGSSWCVNLFCLNICAARNIVRRDYGIKGHCFADIMCSLCCAPCVACQLLAETGKRGSVVDDWDEETGRRDYEQPWKFGLFNCLDDCVTCSYGLFCAMPAVGTVRTQMDDSDWLFNCCCISPCTARSLVRKNYAIEGTDSADCWLTCCCCPCSITQMLNETQHRGKISSAPTHNPMSR